MADKQRKLIIINELLETSSSDEEIEEIENILRVIKEERPKIKNYVNIINEYSDKEVLQHRAITYIITNTFIAI